MSEVSASPTLPLPPPKKSGFQRLIGVLVNPGPTFEDIARKPDVLAPLVVIVIVAFVGIGLTMSHMDWDAMIAQQQEQMKAKNPNMSQADLDRIARMTRSMSSVGIWFAPGFIIVGTVIIAVVLWGAFRMFGGHGNFMQAWSATLYAWMPRVIQSIIGTIVVMAKGKVDPTQMATLVKSSPAFLVDMKEQPFLFALLASFDIFTIWSLILLIIGFAALSKTSRAKAATIIISIWLILTVVKSGFAGLMGRARA